MKWIIILLLVFASSVKASPEKGKVEAEKFLQDPKIKQLNAANYQAGANHIGQMKYEREPHKHALWQQNQNIDPARLEQAGANQAMSGIIGEQIIIAERVRPRFDEITDLKLIATSEQFSKNTEQELIADGVRARMVTDEKVKFEIKTCQHSRAKEEHQCIRYLQPPIVTITPEVRSQRQCSRCGGHEHRDGNDQISSYFCVELYPGDRCNNKIHYTVTDITPRKVEIISKEWVSECHALEARKAKNECKIVKEECLDNKPRVIDGETIIKPCWKYQYTYSCQYPVQVSCEPLLKQGCSPLNSKCIFSLKHGNEDKCYIWEQKYQCPSLEHNIQQSTKYVRPFCLEGECFNTDYAANDEMLTAIAQLDIFAQMQKDVRSGINNIFKGGSQGCNKMCLGIKNCCQISGWGVDFGLTGCSAEEKQLAANRAKGLCIEVGEYCVERDPITKICLRKKTNFCCFHSKLTKAIQEQGRDQLHMNFGEPESPNCRGLTPEELTRIDFSRLNLSEAFSDLKAKVQDPARVNQKLQQNLKELQADFKKQMKGEK